MTLLVITLLIVNSSTVILEISCDYFSTHFYYKIFLYHINNNFYIITKLINSADV